MALTELLKRGYSKGHRDRHASPAPGTLADPDPPSNFMIIYGVLRRVSIMKLFTASCSSRRFHARRLLHAWGDDPHPLLRPAPRAGDRARLRPHHFRPTASYSLKESRPGSS
jgi:hypothetical protein